MVFGNGRGIDDQCLYRIGKIVRNQIHIVFIVNGGSFIIQLLRQTGRSLVVTAHLLSFRKEIADQGTHSDPAGPDTAANAYVFERRVVFHHGDGSTSNGFIDCYKRGSFIGEAKKIRAGAETRQFDDALLRARGQAENYARHLPADEGRPPFLVVLDVGNVIELYAEFTCTGGSYTPFPDPRSHRIRLDDLAKPEIRARLQAVWQDPHSLDPARRTARATRDIAQKLARVAQSLEGPDGGKYQPERVAAFLSRCLFSMFAEDVGLLPKVDNEGAFTGLLKTLKNAPEQFVPLVAELWKAMDEGQFSVAIRAQLPRFNGKLFKQPEVLPLDRDQIDLLLEASRADWAEVEPAIFGTLLESALNPLERHDLGAHYTPRAYVDRLVLPTVIEPLRANWHDTQAAALLLANEGKLKDAADLVRAWHHKLCTTRVLDPACGSGNFLYVTLEHMKRLEGEVLDTLAQLGDTQQRLEVEGLTVDPHQFLGLEINPRAAAIAEMVLWIGYLQWHFRTQGSGLPPSPILRDFKNIECRDAVLTADAIAFATDDSGQPLTRWDGRTTKIHPVTGEKVPDEAAQVPQWRYVGARPATWPQADFIVGNPPFIGNKRMRDALGDGYVQALRAAWPEVPDSADFVMYWWHHAAAQVAAGHTQRMGLITTNSLTMVFNRRVVQAALDQGTHLVMAIPDHPWVDSANGAAVRIAMTVLAAGSGEGQVLTATDEQAGEHGEVAVSLATTAGVIHADLKVGANVAAAQPLRANAKIGNRGVIPHGAGFVVSQAEAAQLGNPPFIRPYRNGRDLTETPRGALVIDAHGLSAEELRDKYPSVYQWLLERVKPEREQNNRARVRDLWWLFAEARVVMRASLSGLKRYIVTGQVAKHRVFQFLDASILPDDKLIAIALDDAFSLGILSSQLHICWALATGGTLEDRPVYSKSTCFDTFPFPDEDTGLTPALRERIATLAEHIDAHRKRVLGLAGTAGGDFASAARMSATQSPPAPALPAAGTTASAALTLTGLYNVLAALRAGRALTAKEKAIHTQGLVGVLRELHDELDAAVLAAYGLPPHASSDAILAHLVQLNTQRAQQEAQGHIRWLRPSFQNPQKSLSKQELVPLENTALEADSIEQKPLSKEKQTQPWPATLPEQVGAVAALLSASPSALTLAEIEACFKGRGAWKKNLPTLLQTLAALGRAHPQEHPEGVAWRAIH